MANTFPTTNSATLRVDIVQIWRFYLTVDLNFTKVCKEPGADFLRPTMCTRFPFHEKLLPAKPLHAMPTLEAANSV